MSPSEHRLHDVGSGVRAHDAVDHRAPRLNGAHVGRVGDPQVRRGLRFVGRGRLRSHGARESADQKNQLEGMSFHRLLLPAWQSSRRFGRCGGFASCLLRAAPLAGGFEARRLVSGDRELSPIGGSAARLRQALSQSGQGTEPSQECQRIEDLDLESLRVLQIEEIRILRDDHIRLAFERRDDKWDV